MRKKLMSIGIALAVCMALTAGSLVSKAKADDFGFGGLLAFVPGTLVVTRSTYTAPKDLIIPGTTLLPPGCTAVSSTCAYAVADAEYPNLEDTNNVWDNDSADGSFGVSSPIFLDDITTNGHLIGTFSVPTGQLVTSFSSKSELALNRSTDGEALTFMGYVAPVNTLDVSASNTPGIVDPTNPVMLNYYRAVAETEVVPFLRITETNAYSGDNGRAAIKADWMYYAVGNSNNGTANPPAVTNATGAELIPPYLPPLAVPDQLGTLSLISGDKPGKETNFRGLTVFDNTLYVSKGSGSNGVNTVYQIGSTGSLPTLQNAPAGPPPLDFPITILPGFPTAAAKNNPDARFPFGIWFANADTLYVADEGDNCTSESKSCPTLPKTGLTAADVYSHAAGQTMAGLEKWVLDKSTGQWNLVYTLQAGLNLGVPYNVANYPNYTDSETGLPLTPATDGLRNIAGRVNPDGTVTVWAVTSTVSGNPDEGADPNMLVSITDQLSATTLPANEKFVTIVQPAARQVLRGVALAPTLFGIF